MMPTSNAARASGAGESAGAGRMDAGCGGLRPRGGFTLLEVLVLGVLLLVLASFLLPSLANPGRRSTKIRCVNNLKQLGISFRVYQGDLGGSGSRLPALEDPARYYAWLLACSNYLMTPKILVCTTDVKQRAEVGTWSAFAAPGARNRAISYFAGPDATELRPANILFGDRAIEARPPLPGFSYRAPRAVLGELGTNAAALRGNVEWTRDAMHRKAGNLALADGSVQQCSNDLLIDRLTRAHGPATRIVQPGRGDD